MKNEIIEYSEALESVEEWKELTELQRKIVLTHLYHPEMNKADIAREVGCKPQNVWSLFHTKYFDKLNKELAKAEKRELLQLALKSLKECLTSKTQLVKLNAAVKVLTDAEVLKSTESETKEQQKITVVWGDDNKTKVWGNQSAVKDRLQPTSEASISPSILSKV